MTKKQKYQKKYSLSSKGKAAQKKYKQSAKGKAVVKKCQKKYSLSAKGKAVVKKFFTPERRAWINMARRAGNADVKVCQRWRVFSNFLADMGKRPKGTSLGRLLDSGNYEPGNAFWQTKKEQQAEASKKRKLTHGTR